MNQNAVVKHGSEITKKVQGMVRQFQDSKQIHLPENYSAENAMKSAYLVLQNTIDRNKKPVLETCTKESITNSLLNMVIQGLNPAKNQCYFIAYNKELTCQRSYMGTVAVVKSLCGAIDVNAQVIWKDDSFEYNIVKGNKEVVKHSQKLSNVGKEPQGAYCIITFPGGKEYTDIMTTEQIKKSWSKSKMNPSKPESTHRQFEEEMMKKTVINRACKMYINSSSDNAVLTEAFQKSEQISHEEAFEAEVTENANQQVIDITPSDDVEKQENKPEAGELTEEEKKEIIAAEQEEAQQETQSKGPSF